MVRRKKKVSLHSPGKGHSMNNAENGRTRNIFRKKKKKRWLCGADNFIYSKEKATHPSQQTSGIGSEEWLKSLHLSAASDLGGPRHVRQLGTIGQPDTHLKHGLRVLVHPLNPPLQLPGDFCRGVRAVASRAGPGGTRSTRPFLFCAAVSSGKGRDSSCCGQSSREKRESMDISGRSLLCVC